MRTVMSKQRAELLRKMYRQKTLAGLAESLHPEAEMHQESSIPDTDDYYGREEFVSGVTRWLDEWESFQYIPEEAVDVGERVLMRVRLSGRGKASGIKLDLTVFHVWEFRDEMPWRCDVFFREDQARKAVGTRK
jgi:hypothetical protein